MSRSTSLYKRYRFPSEIIQYAVWFYHRFNLSYLDIEDLLVERGITVSYESIRLWSIKFGPEFAKRLKRRHQGFGDTFYIDEVFVKIGGQQQSQVTNDRLGMNIFFTLAPIGLNTQRNSLLNPYPIPTPFLISPWRRHSTRSRLSMPLLRSIAVSRLPNINSNISQSRVHKQHQLLMMVNLLKSG